MKSKLKSIIAIVVGIFFCWFFYLVAKGFWVTNKQDMARDEWPVKILGRWKNCKDDVCFNLQFNSDNSCKIILTDHKDTTAILGTYQWEAGEHTLTRTRGRESNYEKDNEIVKITLKEPDANNRFTQYKYIIQSINKDDMELIFSNEGDLRKFVRY
jgi:hypothetical protein